MLLHALIPASRANGPGLRAVVFFQGCTLRCPGCWNPETHPFRGAEVSVDAVVQEVLRAQPQHALAGNSIIGKYLWGMPAGTPSGHDNWFHPSIFLGGAPI